jgi:hypothetical protein
MYDAVLGRWHTQNPKAEKYYSWSPYNYTMNNPTRYIDPNGAETFEPGQGGGQDNDVQTETIGSFRNGDGELMIIKKTTYTGGSIGEPLRINFNGKPKEVLRRVKKWSRYLTQPKFGVKTTEYGRYYHLYDVFKNLPKPSIGGYGTAGDGKIKEYRIGENYFVISIPNVRNRNVSNNIKDRIFRFTEFGNAFQLDFVSNRNNLGVKNSVFTITFKNPEFYKPIGKEIFGENRWQKIRMQNGNL